MQNKVVGDSILFRRYFSEEEGTAITTGTCRLVVSDFSGSQVFSGTVNHRAGGTWGSNVSSTGFSNGPLTEVWNIKADLGTFTFVEQNNFRIIGTTTIRPYVMPAELHQWYEQVPDYFDGSEESAVVDTFNEINSKLEAAGYKMPIRAKADGFYDQPLRDLNAYKAILRIVSRRQSGYNREEETPWFNYFGECAGSIWKKIENKEYNFDREYSVAEAGVGQATKTVGTSVGQLDTNWRGGIGTGFTDFTFERDWVAEITGTGTSGTVNECEFKWSNDGGLTYATQYTTDFDWQSLKNGVHVRFHRGTSTQATNLFEVGDKWTWKTFPLNQVSAGKRSARSY